MDKEGESQRKPPVGLFLSCSRIASPSTDDPLPSFSSSSSPDDDQKKFAPVISPRGEDSELFIYLLCQSGLIGHI